MGLSEFLQTSEFLHSVPHLTPDQLSKHIRARGEEWFRTATDDLELIRHNLAYFGLDAGEEMVSRVVDNVILHYFEKFLPFCGSAASYQAFLASSVDGKNLSVIREALSKGNGVLLASTHFGAVELIPPTLALHNVPINAVLRFRTEQLSVAAHQRAAAMASSGLFGPIRFIEIGKPGTAAALDMAAVLRRREALLSMMDEKTEYSKAVPFLGKTIWGGAGLDRLVAFSSAPVSIFLVTMLRMGEGSYRLDVDEIVQSNSGLVLALFDRFSEVVKRYPEQWYFVHEEIAEA